MSEILLACSVCGQAATEDSQLAYQVMSIIMSLLPLGLIGGVLGWVVMRVRRHREEASRSAAER